LNGKFYRDRVTEAGLWAFETLD